MIVESLVGGVFGGLLRLAPEVIKFFDKKNDREHELKMLNAEMEFAKIKAEQAMHAVDASVHNADMSTLAEALKEQASSAKAGGWFIAALSALVRPSVTYAFVVAYFAVKAAAYTIAVAQGGAWNTVLLALWTQEDMSILSMILGFWFVSRSMGNGRSH